MKSNIRIELTTGSVIEAKLVSSIEELDIVTCLCESLEQCGARIKEYSIIHTEETKELYRRKFRGLMI